MAWAMRSRSFTLVLWMWPANAFKSQAGYGDRRRTGYSGSSVPIAGGYTLGQIVPGKDGNSPRFLISILL